jgi:hypothetical protein
MIAATGSKSGPKQMPESAWKHDPDRPHSKMNPNPNLNTFSWKTMKPTTRRGMSSACLRRHHAMTPRLVRWGRAPIPLNDADRRREPPCSRRLKKFSGRITPPTGYSKWLELLCCRPPQQRTTYPQQRSLLTQMNHPVRDRPRVA